MKQAYGTLEPVEVPQKTSRTKVLAAAVVSFLVVSAVVALSFSTGTAKVEESVDSNRNRQMVTALHSTVEKNFERACNDMTTRFVITQFNDARNKLVPTVMAKADPFDWNNDFKKFKNMLPTYKAATDGLEGEPGVAFAVYDLPVFTNDLKSKFTVIPTFVTYMDRKADRSSKYLGGSFLGAASLAARCTQTTVNINDGIRNLASFCEKTVNQLLDNEVRLHGEKNAKDQTYHKLFPDRRQVRKRCTASSRAQCPFTGSAGAAIGASKVCDKCKRVANWGESPFHKIKGCCEAITELCKGNPKALGCHPYKMAIYSRNCDTDYDDAEDKAPKVALLEGMTQDQVKCAPICGQKGCNSITDKLGKEATFVQCAGCHTTNTEKTYKAGLAQPWTGIARCHQGAPGFVKMACCGMSKDCKTERANRYGAMSCNKAPFGAQKKGMSCVYALERQCGSIAEKQQLAKAAAKKAKEAAAKKAKAAKKKTKAAPKKKTKK